MTPNFSIQISPELILTFTQPHLLPQKPKPKPKPKPAPKPSPLPETLAPLPPPPLPALAPHRPPSVDQSLDPFLASVAECEKSVEILRKQDAIDRQDVQRRARELYEKQYRAHEPKPVPCKEAELACLQCYRQNPQEPLKCGESVRAYVDCTRQLRQRFVFE